MRSATVCRIVAWFRGAGAGVGFGLTGVTFLTAGPYGTCAVVGGLAKCWGEVANVYANLVPTVVRGLSDVKQVGLGYDFACVLTNVGQVSCWGSGNLYGQLGGASSAPSTVPVPAVPVGRGVVGCRKFSCMRGLEVGHGAMLGLCAR